MDIQPGFYDGIPNEEYHGSAGVSSSGVKKLLVSPAHYYAAYLDPEREPTEQTPAMAFGTACHTAVLEPEEYDKRHFVIPEGLDRRRKADKEVIEDLEAVAAAVHGTTIKFEDNVRVHKIAKAVHGTRVWGRLTKTSLCERSYYWIDEDTGVLCKCRPDLQTWDGDAPAEDDLVVDLKSAFDASPNTFQRSAYNLGYHISAAFYLDGVAAVTGVRPAGFLFAAVEKEAPFATAFYMAGEDMIREGRKAYKKALAEYAACQSNGVWPGYVDNIQYLNLPKYFKTTD